MVRQILTGLTKGGRVVGEIPTISDKGERWVGKMLTMADKGGRGGLDPPFYADIICEQLLTMYLYKYIKLHLIKAPGN